MIENGLHQREFGRAISQARTADDIAHHIHIGLQRQLLNAIALDQFNAQSPQLVAHRRIHASVTTGDFMPRLARQSRHATHESATNAQNMNMHRL